MFKPSLCLLAIILTAQAKSSYLLGGKYYVGDTSMTFLQAQVDCRMMGMELARIENATIQVELAAQLAEEGFYDTLIYWVGGIRRNEGRWVWADTGNIISYTNWGTNQPAPLSTTDYCLEFGSHTEPYKWISGPCDIKLWHICQA